VPDLFPYQVEGAQWLKDRTVALLADEMGLGKTPQAIAAADMLPGPLKITVLCPAVGRINWVREFRKFSTCARSIQPILSGSEAKTTAAVRICSYDLADRLPARDDDILILDESHYCKSHEAGRTHTVLGRDGLASRARRIWALSGTPAPNHPGELYVVLRVFGVVTESYSEFVDRYCIGYYGGSKIGFRITGARASAIPELRARMERAGILLRRRKAEVLAANKIPPLVVGDFAVQASPVDLQRHFLPQWQAAGGANGGGDQNLMTRIEREADLLAKAWGDGTNLAVLEQIEGSVPMLRRYVGLQKMPAVVELIKGELEANAYQKIVLFAIHRDVIEGLRDGLKKFRPVTLYGGTPGHKRQDNIDAFQKDPRCRVFVGQEQACREVINLNEADQVGIVESPWTPAYVAQLLARVVGGLRHKKAVTARMFSVAGSIDEAVTGVLRRKTKDFAELFDASIKAKEGLKEFDPFS
jgi:SWI/SNF-related matrix-associated actin-dependent regulator 1 of chromatin subfamily A